MISHANCLVMFGYTSKGQQKIRVKVEIFLILSRVRQHIGEQWCESCERALILPTFLIYTHISVKRSDIKDIFKDR